MVLKADEPMAFEQIEVDENNGNKVIINKEFNVNNFAAQVIEVQYTAISILQERTLTIDQRLAVLGFYFDHLEELISQSKIDEVTKLSLVYTSEDFFNNQALNLVKSVKFNVRDYIKVMFDMFETLYGTSGSFRNNGYYDKMYLNSVISALNITIDKDGTVSVDEMIQNYNKLFDLRNDILNKHSKILENYLVNEFFYNLYPWKLRKTICSNYGVFIMTYKLLELILISMKYFSKNELNDNVGFDTDSIIKIIGSFIQRIDHNQNYIDCISKNVDNKENTLKIMNSLLQI